MNGEFDKKSHESKYNVIDCILMKIREDRRFILQRPLIIKKSCALSCLPKRRRAYTQWKLNIGGEF